jgi:hypothetical protein
LQWWEIGVFAGGAALLIIAAIGAVLFLRHGNNNNNNNNNKNNNNNNKRDNNNATVMTKLQVEQPEFSSARDPAGEYVMISKVLPESTKDIDQHETEAKYYSGLDHASADYIPEHYEDTDGKHQPSRPYTVCQAVALLFQLLFSSYICLCRNWNCIIMHISKMPMISLRHITKMPMPTNTTVTKS